MVETKSKKSVIGFYIGNQYREKLEKRAKANRRSMSTECAMIIERELDKDKK